MKGTNQMPGTGADIPFWEDGETEDVPVPTPTMQAEVPVPEPLPESVPVPSPAPAVIPASNEPAAPVPAAEPSAPAAPPVVDDNFDEHREFVPRLLGLSVSEAEQVARDAGFVAEISPLDRGRLLAAGVNLDTKPVGVVLAQHPDPGTPLSVGSTVVLRDLSSESKMSPAKKSSAKKKGFPFSRNTIIAIVLGLVAILMVAATALGGNKEAPPPTPTPSASPSPSPSNVPIVVAVPNVIGQQASVAKATIQNAGFTYGEELQQIAEGGSGSIVAQSPAGELPAEKGSTINVVAGVGGTGTVLPSVLDLTEDKAAETVRKSGLTLVPSQTVNSDKPAGTVVQQLPAAGQRVPVGGKVLLLLSNGKKKMPNVVGLTEQQAASNLVALGLKVKVYSMNDATKPAGTVIGQSPAKDNYVGAGDEVSITVAAGGPSGSPSASVSGSPAASTSPSGVPAPSGPSAKVIPSTGTKP